jgi:hypothetical protein
MGSDSSSIHRIHPDAGTAVPRAATLDGFAAETAGPGIALQALAPLTALYVQTRNTRYHIIVRRGDEIVIQGGSFFPDPTPARLDGASLGSSLLKLGWIGVGLRMEICAGGQRIVTTAVRSIAHHDSAPTPRPH